MAGREPKAPGDELRLWRKPCDLDAFEAYLIFELGRSQRTADNYIGGLKCLARWVGKDLHAVTPDDLRRFKRESDYAPATKQSVVVAMHRLHDWALLEKVSWADAAMRSVVTPSVPWVLRPPLSLDTARLLMAACRTPLEHRVVFFGLYAGTRIAESASITEREWRGERLTFVGKNSKQRVVPVHPDLQKLRYEILRATPASRGVLHSAFARMRDRTGAVDVEGKPATSHSLRRTFADLLYDRQGVPQEVVGALLGHGKKVTERYAPVRLGKLEEAITKVDYTLGTATQLALFETWG